MKKTPILLLAVLLSIGIALAAPFYNYGHDAYFNETADCGGGLCNAWASGAGTITAVPVSPFNQTNSFNWTSGKAQTMANFTQSQLYNMTWFVNVTAMPTAGGWCIGLRNTTSSPFGDGHGLCIGANQGTSPTNWVYWGAGTVNNLNKAINLNQWTIIELRKTGVSAAQLWINGTNLVNVTSEVIGNIVIVDSNANKQFYVDDLHVWNNTAPLNTNANLSVTLKNLVNGSTLLGYTVNYSNSNASDVNTKVFYCNSATCSLTNFTGNINISVTNITGYFNQTVFNIAFDASVVQTTTINTSQAVINFSAYQLYTNASIQAFTVTSGSTSNTSSTGWTTVGANTGSNSLSVSVPGNISQNNVTCTGTSLTTSKCNQTGFFDDVFTINATSAAGVAVNTFTVNLTNTTLGGLLSRISTTNGTAQFPTLQGYYYYFAMDPSGYAFANATLQANNSGNNFTFKLYTSNIVNFTFYSETNLSTVAGPNITLNLVSTPQSAVYTTINGTITSSVLTPSTYVATYSSTNFTTRNYQFTLVNGTIMSVRLPMLVASGATTVTITVSDKTGSLLSNATVKAYLYDITTNSYILNQVGTSNSEGILTMTMQLNGPNYYFTVDYQGVTRLVTVPSQIYSSSVSLSVQIDNQAFSSVVNGLNLQGSIFNSTPYGTYTFTWTDSDNTASQGCIYAYQFQSLGKNPTLYNFTCSPTSGGTVNTSINNASNISYYLYGIVTKGGVDYTLDTKLIVTNQSSVSEAQSPIWLFVMLLVIVVLALIFRKSPAIAVFIVGLVPVLFSGAGLIAISLAYTTPLFVIALVIAVVIGQPWK